MTVDYEKLGVFYLGEQVDPAGSKRTGELLLYDAKDLTTHAVCVGMTGSGKTGLCVSLLEEAAIDGIPAIVIDPKGDLGNLLLSFPDLAPSDFEPWIDPGEAARKGMTVPDYARKTAETWTGGLADWNQTPDRIRMFRQTVDMDIYTPGSTSGRPLSVLRSFDAPPPALIEDPTALRDRIMSAVSGILGLLGIDADPITSREHILISTILDRAWREGRSLDIPQLIAAIQKPGVDQIGVFDLESFFPAKDRMGLAMMLNNLLASPGFGAWMQGEPLDVQRLLYTESGKPRISILSIAHLSDAERMFFVTILLNEVLAWMRSQPGTASLRALLYMDEIFGYFPPTANPPSKAPMLTLLKQARAFGLGIVLATQNPVDLDYKGLSNTGTWMIGRLQTERDKMRIIEGLESAGSGPALDRQELDRLLSNLGSRVFLMRNVHEKAPVLFQTRWVLSYLRGPLTLPQIRALSGSKPAQAVSTPPPAPRGAVETPAPARAVKPVDTRPVLPPDVAEVFLRPARFVQPSDIMYRPFLMGSARLHFALARVKVDTWQTRELLAPFGRGAQTIAWPDARVMVDRDAPLDTEAPAGCGFADLPSAATVPGNYKDWEKMLKSHLYQSMTLDVYRHAETKLVSEPGEGEGDFKVRVAQAVREQRDIDIEKVKASFEPKLARLEERYRKAEHKLATEKAQVGSQTVSTMVSFGATVLGALLGRRAVSTGTVTRAGSAIRGAGRISKEKRDVAVAEETLENLEQQMKELEAEFEEAVKELKTEIRPETLEVETVSIRPRKSDISITRVALAWTPWSRTPDGLWESLLT